MLYRNLPESYLPTMNEKNFLSCLTVFVLMGLLAACGTTPPATTPVKVEEKPRDGIARPSEKGAAATQRYTRGDYGGAAAEYRKLADTAESEVESIDYRLQSADAYARAGQNELAFKELKHIDADLLDDEQRLRLKIIRAQIALNAGRPREVFNLLPQEASGASIDTQVRLGTIRSDAWLALNRHTDAVLERIDIDPMITGQEARTLNHQWIWNHLQDMPRENIFSPPPGMSQDDAGWWSLAAIVKKGDYKTPQGHNELAVWRQTYPGHPATEDILFFIESGPAASSPAVTGEQYSGTALEGTPRQVALLLPLSGQYADAGRSVLNGFRDAADRAVTGYVDFKVFDSADITYPISMIAQHAVQDGAEMIVGPLQKSELAELLAAGNVGVPILALNTLPEGQTGMEGLFQFSLSPENEAAEVALKALNDGRYRAVVLASQDATGERIANAFMSAYEQNGGRIIAYDSFPNNSNGLSQIMKKLLRAESADPLWEDVRKGTERTSESEQRIDMIFFTASPRDARILRPVVQLQRAYDLPVYSTARVYSQPDPVMDRDLDGLIFCDMPERLRSGSVNPLSAMGADAYQLVNQLEGLTSSPGYEIPGYTGRLSVTHDGRIWRHLDCAVFRNGQPQRLP